MSKQQLSGLVTFSSGKLGDFDIWTLDLGTGTVSQITFGENWNDKPSFSPNGEWIVFTSNRTGYPEVYKTKSNGSDKPVQLTSLDRWCDSPRFSPDGTKIAFVSNEAGNNDIWVMDADGENRRQITQHEGSDSWVDWTPDGRGLMWCSDRDEKDSDIWFFDLKTSQKMQLTTNDGADFSPVASPCGTLVAFISNRQMPENTAKPFADRDKDIWLMSADGSNEVRLTSNQGCDQCVCWSPCGTKMMYSTDNSSGRSHLRIMDVSAVVEAFASGDSNAIEKAASRIRDEEVQLDRNALKAEIDATRNATFLTQMLPEKWFESAYPAGYFGHERFPHWVNPVKSASANASDEMQSNVS